MATIGNTTGPRTYDNALSALCINVTMPEAGVPTSVWYYGTIAAGESVYAALYTDPSTGSLLVQQAAAYSPGAIGTKQWHQIALAGGAPTLGNGDPVTIAIGQSGSAGGVIDRDFSGPPNGQFSNYINPTSWPATLNSGNDFADGSTSTFSLYLEYTPGGGGSTTLMGQACLGLAIMALGGMFSIVMAGLLNASQILC